MKHQDHDDNGTIHIADLRKKEDEIASNGVSFNETQDHTQTSIVDRYFCISCHSTHSPAERTEKFRLAMSNAFPFITYVPVEEREKWEETQQKFKEALEWDFLEWKNRKYSVRVWDWITEPKISFFSMMVGMLASHFLIQLLTWGLR